MTTLSPARRASAPPAVAIGSVLVLLAAALLWWLLSGLIFAIPTPAASVRALVHSFGDPDYLDDLRVTGIAALSAFAIGTVVGGLAGIGLGLSRRARTLFEPMVIGLNGLPKIVLYPLLLPVFHLGYGSKVVMGVLFALFPVLINVEAGVREIPPIYRTLARSLQASRRQYATMILLPAIRRPLLTGVRLAVSLAMVGVVLSEFFATDKGLGRVVLSAYSAGEYADMMGTILLLLIVSFAVSFALWELERRVR
ncbi:ABC transporter permease [Actinoallomurus acaciae]|uniref:ABC transporter permease n=1 Tax=Actinoallomurus acaciae TaxID=502577 RepID=A0ABV5YPU4_9ACTN